MRVRVPTQATVAPGVPWPAPVAIGPWLALVAVAPVAPWPPPALFSPAGVWRCATATCGF